MTATELIGRERELRADPSNYPYRGARTLSEYWEFWTPARLVKWREDRWRAAGMDRRTR